jgi:hypothetical protein
LLFRAQETCYGKYASLRLSRTFIDCSPLVSGVAIRSMKDHYRSISLSSTCVCNANECYMRQNFVKHSEENSHLLQRASGFRHRICEHNRRIAQDFPRLSVGVKLDECTISWRLSAHSYGCSLCCKSIERAVVEKRSHVYIRNDSKCSS